MTTITLNIYLAYRHADKGYMFLYKVHIALGAQVLSLGGQEGIQIVDIAAVGQGTWFSTGSIDQRVTQMRIPLVLENWTVLWVASC